ncbi:MAG: serine/threonine-protein kinase [Polyangiaceae bacterium]
MPVSDDRSSGPRPPAADPLAGTPYRTEQLLGGGGMGEVVAAVHVVLDRRVVVKLLRRELMQHPSLVDRMRLEAQSLALLAHPHIVAVTDLGQTPAGRPYVVMERLYGRTLRAELKARRVFPVAEAIEYAHQALAGLAAAHERGIVHRDIKLDNLFVCDPPAGGGARQLKLLDFGLAKIISEAAQRTSPAPLSHATEEGMALGTPKFFSPEQARGMRVDSRADLYSLGAVLYALLTGRAPFDHVHGVIELIRAHVYEVPAPPSAHAPQTVPTELDRIVLRALEKRPEDRFESAPAFASALREVARALRTSAPWMSTEPATASPRRGAAAAATAEPGPDRTIPLLQWAAAQPPAARRGPARLAPLPPREPPPPRTRPAAPDSTRGTTTPIRTARRSPQWVLLALVAAGTLLLSLVTVVIVLRLLG